MAEQWRILVVEGEENLNWNIVNSLQKDGYSVLGVIGTTEAIHILWTEEYDVVICGQQLPETNGFELLQWMRTYAPHARMVMLGISGDQLSRTQALENGVAAYLEKPLDIHALKEELRHLLHQTGFSASLDSFDLLDVIQIITLSHKSIALVVNTGLEERGILRFQAGELIWAEYGILRGEEAFFALAAHKNGTVVHHQWNEQITPNVSTPLSRLIFQALQYRAKYAEYQQMSNELEVVQPANGNGKAVSASAVLSPFSPALSAENGLDFAEDDDRPFQFVTEDVPGAGEGERMNEPVAAWGSGPLLDRLEAREPGERGDDASAEEVEEKKAWWEPTGAHPSLPSAAQLYALADENARKAFPRGEHIPITSEPARQVNASESSPLPSWLTDQPTDVDLPVLRGNTGQVPAAPPERSPAQPRVAPSPDIFAPGVPVQGSEENAEWPEFPLPLPRSTGKNPIPPGERKMRSAETPAQPTPGQPAVGSQSKPAPAEWQAPPPQISGPLPKTTGQSGPVRSIRPPARRETDSRQSPTTPRRPVAVPAATPVTPLAPRAGGRQNTTPFPGNTPAPAPATPGIGTGTGTGTGTGGKRNYPALTAALQTIGYSLLGFVAAAVVSIDGTPIAQVAVDDTDVSPLCPALGVIARNAPRLDAGESEDENASEHIVITNSTRHILLRFLNQKKDVFQVLITTHESAPAESLNVLENVQDALAAAL